MRVGRDGGQIRGQGQAEAVGAFGHHVAHEFQGVAHHFVDGDLPFEVVRGPAGEVLEAAHDAPDAGGAFEHAGEQVGHDLAQLGIFEPAGQEIAVFQVVGLENGGDVLPDLLDQGQV